MLALSVAFAGLLVTAGPAVAKTIQGGPAPETLVGTPKGDQIFGRGAGDSLIGHGGADHLVGGPGGDSIDGGPGRDVILGGPGSDRVFANDGFADRIDCGPGWDVAVVDELDTVVNCEVVKRRAGAVAPTQPSAAPTQTSTSSTQAGTTPIEPPVVPGKETEKEAKEKEEKAQREKVEAEEEEREETEREEEEEKEERNQETIPVYEEHALAMFPENNGWTGNGVGTYEESGAPFIVNNDRSYKIQSDGKGDESVATSPLLTPTDLTSSHVTVQSAVSFSANLGEIRLRLASGDISTEYAEATVWREGRDPTILGGTFESQSIPTAAFAVTGSVDWSKIDRAQLIVTDKGAAPVIYYVAGIYAVPTYRTPIVSFAFDDSLATTFTLGLKKLSAYRMPASEYVIADAIGTPGFLTEEQLYTLRNLDHWEIGGHAATLADHNEPNGLDSLSPEKLKADFEAMHEWMHERGFAQRTFAYPQGAASPEVRKYAQRDYCAARVTAAGPETIPPRNPFTLRGFSVDSSESHLAQLEAEVDRAIAQKSWLILTFHNLVTGTPGATTDFNYTEFSELVDYIQARRAEGALKVRTIADAVGC